MCIVGGAGPDKRIKEIIPDSVIKELTEAVRDILSIISGRAEVELIEAPLVVSYPKSGKKTLTAGMTTINIKGRQVILADDTVDDLYSPRAFEKCRSLLIFTDRTVDVRVLNGGDVVFVSSFFIGSQQWLNLGEFDSVVIDATDDTQFYIAMSEDPEGAPSTIQSAMVDGKTEVISSPTGGARATDSDTTVVGSFTEIVSYTPASGVTFSLAKILVTWSGTDEQQIRVRLDTEVVAYYHATGYVMDWFPPETELVGDGTKKVVVEAEATTVVATLTGFIAGEES